MGKSQPIHKACLEGDLKTFNKLSNTTNFKINKKDNINFTPLMCASFSGSLPIVKKLLKMDNIQINSRSRNGKTALIIASTRGHYNIVKLLIVNGANLNVKQFKKSIKPCKPKTALDMSIMCNYKKISKLLKSKKATKNGKFKKFISKTLF